MSGGATGMDEEIIEASGTVGFSSVAVNKTKPDLGGAIPFDGVVEHRFDVVGVSTAVELALLGKDVPLHGAEAALVLPDYVPRVIVVPPHLFLHPLPHRLVRHRAFPQMLLFDLRVQILHNMLCHARTVL